MINGNIGSLLAHKKPGVGFAQVENEEDKYAEKLIEKASQILRPEFVNRLTEVVMFKPFDEKSLNKIIDLELKPVKEKLKKRKITLSVSKTLKEEIIKDLKDSKFGARPISRIIQKQIEDPLATLLISSKLKENSRILFSIRKGKVLHTIKEV